MDVFVYHTFVVGSKYICPQVFKSKVARRIKMAKITVLKTDKVIDQYASKEDILTKCVTAWRTHPDVQKTLPSEANRFLNHVKNVLNN